MFTGIIETVGKIKSVSCGKLEISVPGDWKLSGGESCAVNGVCLTVTGFPAKQPGGSAVGGKPGLVLFSMSPETAARTTLRLLKPGSAVNLERALVVGARLGGHFVTGHVDGTARLLSVSNDGNSRVIEVEKAGEAALAEKGSVALDGISLTVYGISGNSFKAAVIPHTWEHTALKNLGLDQQRQADGHRHDFHDYHRDDKRLGQRQVVRQRAYGNEPEPARLEHKLKADKLPYQAARDQHTVEAREENKSDEIPVQGKIVGHFCVFLHGKIELIANAPAASIKTRPSRSKGRSGKCF
ncbi:MAG: riboflavin synthase [Elusimicrobia bacterium]|nr:riboflavin synthase [Elusimicrobiota bacterium]